MKWPMVLLSLCLLLLPLSLGAEPMRHPVSGEEGFWVSKAQMQETVFQLQQAEVCEETLVAFRISMQEATQTIDKMRRLTSNLTIAEIITASIATGLLIWLVAR